MSARKRLAALPKFEGQTAWDLLDFITWVIQREPKRYNQGDWIQMVEQGFHADYVANAMPACGTIGCVAGWVDLLVTGRQVILDIDKFAGETQERAKHILGLSRQRSNELFGAQAVNNVREWLPVSKDADGYYPESGTRAYAALGVLHIRAFMQRYEKSLRRTLVRKGTAIAVKS